MRIDCEVMDDLLPLYIEELTCEESNKIVEEHLNLCPICRDKYEKLKAGNTIEDDGSKLKMFANNFKYNKLLYLMSVVFTIYCGWILYNERGVTHNAGELIDGFFPLLGGIFVYSIFVGRHRKKEKYTVALFLGVLFTFLGVVGSFDVDMMLPTAAIYMIMGTIVSIIGISVGNFISYIEYMIKRMIMRLKGDK